MDYGPALKHPLERCLCTITKEKALDRCIIQNKVIVLKKSVLSTI